MADRSVTCCFTGHRPSKLPWGNQEEDSRCLALKAEILDRLQEIYALGYRHFICGMALGCDSYYFQCLLKLRRLHPEIELEAAVPCDTQSDGWTALEKERYRFFLSECTQVTYVHHIYTRGCMQQRNKYMIDNSSLLLTCFNGTQGGTMGTILMAHRAGLQILTIDL